MPEVSLLVISTSISDALSEILTRSARLGHRAVVVLSPLGTTHEEIPRLAARFPDAQIVVLPRLGYVEPYRHVGLALCNTDWVFNLDADESPSPDLWRDLELIVSQHLDNSVLYVPRRFLLDGTQSYGNLMRTRRDFAPRILNRKKVTFRGLIHERPETLGPVAHLDGPYYIAHSHHSALDTDRLFRYISIDVLTRRFTIETIEQEIPESLGGSVMKSVLRAYALTSKKARDEPLSIRELSLARRVEGLAGLRNLSTGFLSTYWRAELRTLRALDATSRRLTDEISRDIWRSGGVVSYLGLSSTAGFDRLASAGASLRLEGVQLLLAGLVSRFRSGTTAFDWTPESETLWNRLKPLIRRECARALA
jgi:hypothetical protein